MRHLDPADAALELKERRRKPRSSEQPGLFDAPAPPAPGFQPHTLARCDDPATSKVAAAQAEQLVHGHEIRILSFLEACGDRDGRTKDEIARGTGLDAVAVARRMRKLADLGRVEESGTGKSPAGRPAIRWRAVS